MDLTCDEEAALILENNTMVSEVMKKHGHSGIQQEEFYLKLNGFLDLLDKLKVHKRNHNNKERLKECLEFELAVMCNTLWLWWTSDNFHNMYNPILLCRIDADLSNVLLSVLKVLGELGAWPDALSGRNTYIPSYMKLVLEKIMLSAVNVKQIMHLCILSILYLLKLDPGDEVLGKCINLITMSRTILKKMSEMEVETMHVLSSVPKKSKKDGSVSKERLCAVQFELHQCTYGHQSSFSAISEALTVVQNLCCTKLKNRENAMALLTSPADHMTCFHYINLYVKGFAFICHSELKLSSAQLWRITQLAIGKIQKAAFHVLHGFYLMSNGFYGSAHKQLVKAVGSNWMMITLQLLCYNYSFLITEITDKAGIIISDLLECYIQLLKTFRSAVQKRGKSSVQLYTNFECGILNYIYIEPKYSDYSIQYEISRSYARCENYVSASEEYLSLLASLSRNEFFIDSKANSFSKKQGILPNIRLVIHETILVHLKSSQLETAFLLCKMSMNQKSVPYFRVQSAEDYILHIKDDIIAMMLAGEVCMEMGKPDEGKDILVRSIDTILGYILNTVSNSDAECGTHTVSVSKLLSYLLAKVYMQIAKCCLQNNSTAEVSNFLQQSLELNRENREAVLLYQKIHTGTAGDISNLFTDSQEKVNVPLGNCRNLAIRYLLK